MGWAQTARVLLVWPPRGRVLARRLDLLLLARHAARLGAHLALVTTDTVVRDNARELGLPAFDTVEDSRRAPWRGRPSRTPARRGPAPNPAQLRPGRRRASRLALPAWLTWALRGLVFAVGLAALGALLYAVVPGASITLAPQARPLEVSVEVIADPVVQATEGNLIPARTVRVEVEATGRTPTTGVSDVPTRPARGTVIFTSLDGTAAIIPQGTGVRTTAGTPVRFRTIETVTLERRIGATAATEVQAVDLGPVGNIGGGRINAIDGPLGLQLAVTNPGPMTGGASSPLFSVTAADRQRVRSELSAQLQATGLAAIQAQLSPGEFLVPDSVAVADVLAATYDYAVGEHADTVQLTLRLAVTGLAVSEDDARQVAQAALTKEVRAGEARLPEQEQYERDAGSTVDQEGRAHFRVTARGAALPLIDREAIRQAVRGQPIDQTQLVLTSRLPLSQPPLIEVRPAWLQRLPWLPLRIDVIVLGGQAS